MKHTRIEDTIKGDGWHVYGGSGNMIYISIDKVFYSMEEFLFYIAACNCIDVDFNRDNLIAHIAPDYYPQGAIIFYYTIGNERQLWRVNIDWIHSTPPWVAQCDLVGLIKEHFPDIKIMKKAIDGDGHPFEQEIT